jgi:hypothetical protein
MVVSSRIAWVQTLLNRLVDYYKNVTGPEQCPMYRT